MKNIQNKAGTLLYVLNIALRLVVICAVIALLVATVNYFAAPVIEENSRIATQNAISALFDGKEISTNELAIIPEEHVGTVDMVYTVTDADGSFIGYCVVLSPTGFKGEVNLIAAFDTDGFIKGVEITATNDETANIGTKVKDKSFTDKFIESSEQPAPDDVNHYIIARATKTSKPVAQSVLTAKAIIADYVSKNSEEVPAE